MPDTDPRLEAACRAACIAEGCDPDQDAIGLGATMPCGARYKLWEARVKTMRAGIIEFLGRAPTPAMLDAPGVVGVTADADYAAMCEVAVKEVAGE